MPSKLEEAGISWVILGAQTKPTIHPKLEDMENILSAAYKADIPVFLKDNLPKTLPVSRLFYQVEKRLGTGAVFKLPLKLRQELLNG